MHGFTHVYDKETNKKDFFNYGGRSEFFGHSYDEQFKRIKKSLEIFKKENIEIRSFFAPNHTYDQNTFFNPHDVCIDNDENIYVPQWNSGKTYPLKLTRV